jgi:hypothetical protein
MEASALREKFEHMLSKYVPEGAAGIVASWVIDLNFDLHISHERQSKYGDYRYGHGYKRPRISVNHNLNPYAFLVTLVHEVAHLTSHKKYGSRIKPHGVEWKQEFRLAMRPFFLKKTFPPHLETALQDYLNNPAASSCSDENLYRTLKSFDDSSVPYVHLEDLKEGAVFRASRGRIFTKGPRLRKRFKCREESSGHYYLFSPVAEVVPSENSINSAYIRVSVIPNGSVFFDKCGKAYRKDDSFGSGYQCTEISTGKAFWFSADMEVTSKKV